MMKLYGILVLLMLSSNGAAQDAPVEPPADAAVPVGETAEPAEEVAPEPDLIDDPDLDEQTYEEDEDVFVPSEEIPSDEPIPFPTNI